MLGRLRALGLRLLPKTIAGRSIAAALGLLACAAPIAVYAQAADGLRMDSLKLSGFNYEKGLTGVYLGDFGNSGLEPESGAFTLLFPVYVTSFARSCHAYLPKNRVEIMTQECARTSTPVNIYGNPVGASSCIEYRTVGTGLYADPELLAISKRMQAGQGGKLVGDLLNLRGGDPLSSTRNLTDLALLVKSDMDKLFGANLCDSKAVKRLQDNMVRFARGDAPLRLAKGETLADLKAQAPKRDPSRSANYSKLIDDLIAENAKGWMLNQYIRGSVQDANVQGEDASGRPRTIRASYRYSQLGSGANGSVVLTFEQGLPKCLYFFDAPSTCRVASPRIANAYDRGEY